VLSGSADSGLNHTPAMNLRQMGPNFLQGEWSSRGVEFSENFVPSRSKRSRICGNQGVVAHKIVREGAGNRSENHSREFSFEEGDCK
jgi:hypothetical protein